MAEDILNFASSKLRYLNVSCSCADGEEDKYVVETTCVSGSVKFFVRCTVLDQQERRRLEVEHVCVVLENELDLVEMSRWVMSWEKAKDTATIYHALTEYGQLVAARDQVIGMLQENHASYFQSRRCNETGHYFVNTLDPTTGSELMHAEWAIEWDVHCYSMADKVTFAFGNQDEWLFSKLSRYIDLLCGSKSLAADELKWCWQKLAEGFKYAVSLREENGR